MKRRLCLLLPALGALLLALPAHAQLQIKGGTFNHLRANGNPTDPDGTPPVVTPQYAGVAGTSATAGAIAITGQVHQIYPAGVQQSGGTVVGGTVLKRASFGGTFASGVPRYSLGDQILPPETIAHEGNLALQSPAPADYWRSKPVEVGEQFTNPGSPTPVAPNPLPPADPDYYYSPHANRVFAHQSGQVGIVWVTRQPVGPNGTTAPADNPKEFRFRQETFNVSSGTSRPVRTIYWTERSFNGPKVNIPTGRIVTVNAAYNDFFPSTVAVEYEGVGVIPGNPNASPPPELRTLWFENTAGLGQLHAYNLEGRVFIEYLGPLVGGSGNVHEFLGADVIEVIQAASSTTATVKLGGQIQPVAPSGQVAPDADLLLPSPVLNLNQGSITYYGTSARPDGRLVYHAEWENDTPDRVSFYWLEERDAAIHFLASPATPGLGIAWPKYLNRYYQDWPASLADYDGVTVTDTGSTTDTGVQFSGGSLPDVVHQDDGAQTEVSLNLTTQRLVVDLSQSSDKTNRTLLKFSTGNPVWYVRLFIQSQSVLGSPEIPDPDGPGPLEFTPAVFTLADRDGDGVRDFSPEAGASGHGVLVGQRIEAPGAAYQAAGYIAEGTCYLPSAYQNPFIAGVGAAAAGAIIPVNAAPGNDRLTIWWFTEVTPPGSGFESFFVPVVSAQYTVSYPTNAGRIVMASNAGTGDLGPSQAAGTIYFQNDPAQPGYNPNEEHALMLGGRAYALRDDLNVTSGENHTSEPFVLISYTDPIDNRPAMEVYEVLREDVGGGDVFDYTVTAGSRIPAPMPLPLLPLPIGADGQSKNIETTAADNPTNATVANHAAYNRFTFRDRKGHTWVHRGAHGGGSGTLSMKLYYPSQAGFFIPGTGEPPAGTVLPFLRNAARTGTVMNINDIDNNEADQPLTIIYRPQWPDNVPELRVAETLTLPKFGLPQVRGQTSVQVLYQQSLAQAATISGLTKNSVTLHDSTRAKRITLSAAGLDDLPSSIATTIRNGRTYFQRVPPHLQQRCYMNPILGGALELVLEGEFVDEIAGEDYLNPNVLSAADMDALKGLAAVEDPRKGAWDAAIGALFTQVQTFVENPNQKGTYIVQSSDDFDADELVVIGDSDTAVDSYALTATGQGTGYVSLLFGDGEAFTPAGDPVSIGIIKVPPRLYGGDMKVVYSSNPLDEQVTLRHSGDFAAKPDDYQFEWRYASLVDGLPPATYAYGSPATVLGNTTTWRLVQNPSAARPSDAEYDAGTDVTFTGPGTTVTVYDANHGGGSLPGVALKSGTDADFSGGVPAQIIFSADLPNGLDGFVLYVNGIETLAFRAPAPFSNSNAVAGLSNIDPLPLQFNLSPNHFTAGLNTVEVALYSTANPLVSSSVNFRLETVSRTDKVDPAVFPGSPWQQPNGTLLNLITLGGSPTAPLGHPTLLMQDNAFTVRYRPKIQVGNVLAPGSDQSAVPWSDWMPAQVVPGWVKRVLDAINPYNQRVTDLFNNAVNTDVSVLTQAGTRWEGDIALNLDSVNDAGLIAIYETVLNRAKLFSIENGYDLPGVNDALLLAAGYLNDLYIILGNEAYADAANPTISLDDQDTITEVNTSRFSFEGQLASSLEEELALLRGRDDFLATSVSTAPAYNRLYWNFTNGIDSGEVLYAVNYNIKEKVGSPTQDGIIDAADAQRMFPQAHGDAYGHYLTALKGYYKLLTNPNFTWTPRSEVVTVLGQNVSVDYYDERKFAGAAANVARTAEQIMALTWRQRYQDDDAAGWEHFRDNQLNTRTNESRQWGLDEWASRATGGAYIHWLVGNSMLPEEDTNPNHNGIQIVDRRTVPELAELANAGASFQSILDNANAHLNPLGLSPDAVAFDISPSALKAGHSHFEQVYDRALDSVLNAKGAFDQAGRMTRLLRNQTNQIDDYNTAIEEQERAFKYQLIDLFGTPYTADVGAGKTYVSNYDGPDLIHWFLIDEATDANLFGLSQSYTTAILKPEGVDWAFDGTDIGQLYNRIAGDNTSLESFVVTIEPNRLAQVADDYFGSPAGERMVTGELQTAMLEARENQTQLLSAADEAKDLLGKFDASYILFNEMIKLQRERLKNREDNTAKVTALLRTQKEMEALHLLMEAIATGVADLSEAVDKATPDDVGLSNDPDGGIDSSAHVIASVAAQILRLAGVGSAAGAGQLEVKALKLDRDFELALDEAQFDFSQRQFIYEFKLLYEQVQDQSYEVAARAEQYQRATEEVRNVLARGDRILAEREIFRLRAAAIIQGYRTRDVAFRAFRNEALEQYRTLFDLGSRYTYLAAKSYDYETGLLGTPEGQAVINRIVSARALGDLTNGVPQATTSTLGDAGLAGTMAQLKADFAVAEGRLGINNPDQNGTLFSLRHELFRIANDPARTDDDTAWQQTLEQHIVSDVMGDPDIAKFCQNIAKPDGSRVPGIVIPFSTSVLHGMNWFGLPYAGGDHNFSPSTFATKIYSAGVVFDGYTGMDPYAFGTPNAGSPATNDPDVLGATPYLYLIPTGTDSMRAPPLGDTNTIRNWNVADQALPLPYNLGANDFNGTQFFQTNGTLTEQPWITRKHQAFRAVNDPAFFYSLVPQEFTSSRLVGRSVWNNQWKLVIPAYTLLNDEEEGLERFTRSVGDIKVFLRTYSNSGN